MTTVEKWGIFEVSYKGKTDGNPFVDYYIEGEFTSKNETKTVSGFYDGDGTYIVRFMPSFEESYSYTIKGSFSDEVYTGEFTATAPSEDNHGPVRVVNGYHFAYEDTKAFYPVGTTCYVWNHQPKEIIDKTIDELKKGYFNKIRFCIFPKHYDYNFNDPDLFPYEGTPCDSSVLTKENFMQYLMAFSGKGVPEGNNWDFYKFNPEYFRHFEECLEELLKLNIEADIIVMHPYDRWGFSAMAPDQDDLYWNYVLARLSAYRNVWWSLANEFDLLKNKTIADWERYAKIICEKDPYNHLRSIHNCNEMYDHTRPWITHCSIQRIDLYKCAECTNEYRVRYGKPVVLDEIAYEGDIQHAWGNISGQELTRRFWESAVRGGYATHGETFLPSDTENSVLWWSHGGELHGESGERIKFLHQILSETPGYGLKFYNPMWDFIGGMAENDPNYMLFYCGFFRPKFKHFFFFDENADYEVDVIDTWNMTIEHKGILHGKFRVDLPGKEYMAIRVKKV